MSKDEKRRFWILGGVVALIFAAFIYRLMLLQIAQGEDYAAQATKGYTATQTIPAARGEIVDRYGRPFTTNRIGFDIILDRAFLPTATQNQVIEDLTLLMDDIGQGWIDNLPISNDAPFVFLPDKEVEVERLKRHLGVAEYASAEECFSWLSERYGFGSYDAGTGTATLLDRYGNVSDTWDAATVRKLVGIRYEMEQRSFSLRNTYTFAEDVGSDCAIIVSNHGYELPGVSVVQSTVREFVEGDLAPHIIGNIGPIYAEEMEQLKEDGLLYDAASNPTGYKGNELVGKYGIESEFEDYLRGQDGVRTISMDSNGNVIGVEETVPPTPGNTVVLTLDKDLQRVAQDSLEETIKDLQTKTTINAGMYAEAGSVVAVEVKTGEVLAMATYPSYDNATYYQDYNELSKQKPEPLLNRATMGTYRPGSTYKASVAVAGLAEGVITPTETVLCSGRYTRFSDYQPRCLYVNGHINVVGALQVSCNVFFYETGYRLGIDRQNEYSSKLGLGQKTGIEIPERAGQLSSPETQEAAGAQWSDGNVIQSAIGQLDHQFTPVQMASYVATLANKGQRMQLHLVSSIREYNFEETVLEKEPTVIDSVEADPQVFEVVKDGMVKATQPGGTSAWYWTGFDLTVASKTGTPEASGDNLDSCYICYIPAEDPQIAIAVIIEKGGQGYTGAPVARAIAEEYFYGSTPSEEVPEIGVLLP